MHDLNHDDTINFRLKSESKEKFKTFCTEKLDKSYTKVLRELVEALPEGRVKITPTAEQIESMNKIYNV